MKKYTLFVGGTEVNDYLMNANEVNELKSQYIDDGYDDDDVRIVPINIEQEYTQMREELRRNKLTEMQQQTIAKGILMYEKFAKKEIRKSIAKAEAKGQVYMLGEDFPRAMNHDIFLKIGANRSDYAQFIELNKIEE